MSYRIEWRLETLRRFADELELLDQAAERKVINALREIDHLLLQSPLDEGESRESEFHRILVYPPVSVVYRIDARLRVIRIVHARILKT